MFGANALSGGKKRRLLSTKKEQLLEGGVLLEGFADAHCDELVFKDVPFERGYARVVLFYALQYQFLLFLTHETSRVLFLKIAFSPPLVWD